MLPGLLSRGNLGDALAQLASQVGASPPLLRAVGSVAPLATQPTCHPSRASSRKAHVTIPRGLGSFPESVTASGRSPTDNAGEEDGTVALQGSWAFVLRATRGHPNVGNRGGMWSDLRW